MTPIFSQLASQDDVSQEGQIGGIRATLTPQFATAATLLGEQSQSLLQVVYLCASLIIRAHLSRDNILYC